jgi:hypothetical protein
VLKRSINFWAPYNYVQQLHTNGYANFTFDDQPPSTIAYLPLMSSGLMVPARITSPASPPEWHMSGDSGTNFQLHPMASGNTTPSILGQINDFAASLMTASVVPLNQDFSMDTSLIDKPIAQPALDTSTNDDCVLRKLLLKFAGLSTLGFFGF